MKRPDRDVYTPKHPTPSPGVPAFVDDDLTGQYAGEDLAQRRAKRPTDERIKRLEDKHDKLDDKVDDIHGDVREMRGELKAALGFMAEQQVTQRIRISTNGKVIIAIVGAIGTAIGVIVTALSGCV
jgi:hypothetical protein